MKFEYPTGATPLDPEEVAGLIPNHIVTQAQLNDWEHANIIDGEHWAQGKLKSRQLDSRFVRELHLQMFGNTWKWAGTFRTTGKNIGVDAAEIAPALHDLCEDVRTQVLAASMPLDEIAVRLSHRLVAIHPFPNGNGRLSRTCADWFVTKLGGARFSWGANTGCAESEVRKEYIAALRSADAGDIGALLRFARSSTTGTPPVHRFIHRP
jgi:Fic-DOC domain mobile mystery protein B